METNTKKTIVKYTKKRIKEILKMIEEKAIKDIEKSLNSGAISENSDFLKDNHLLAMVLIKNASEQYKIKTKEYKKEESNLLNFI